MATIQQEKSAVAVYCASSLGKKPVYEKAAHLPIVIIRNFEHKGGPSKDEVMNTISQWAATLADNKVCALFILSKLCFILVRRLPTLLSSAIIEKI